MVLVLYAIIFASDTESDNLALGYEAMTTNTGGGISTMLQLVTTLSDAITSGDANTCIGMHAGTDITTGINQSYAKWLS